MPKQNSLIMRKLKLKNTLLKLIKFALFIGLLGGVLRQPVSAYNYNIEPRALQPFEAAYDYDFKYSPEFSSAASSQVTDPDEVDNSNYDVFDGAENDLGYSYNNQKRSSKIHVYRRGCIRRNGACDHRPKDCCYNSSCRCNLWGSNCRCQRMGLFQKWG